MPQATANMHALRRGLALFFDALPAFAYLSASFDALPASPFERMWRAERRRRIRQRTRNQRFALFGAPSPFMGKAL